VRIQRLTTLTCGLICVAGCLLASVASAEQIVFGGDSSEVIGLGNWEFDTEEPDRNSVAFVVDEYKTGWNWITSPDGPNSVTATFMTFGGDGVATAGGDLGAGSNSGEYAKLTRTGSLGDVAGNILELSFSLQTTGAGSDGVPDNDGPQDGGNVFLRVLNSDDTIRSETSLAAYDDRVSTNHLWIQDNLTLDATGGAKWQVELRGYDDATSTINVHFDNVTLTAVPTPGALAGLASMTMIGLVGLGLRRWRRR
jgi:hypothetical protein